MTADGSQLQIFPSNSVMNAYGLSNDKQPTFLHQTGIIKHKSFGFLT